MAAKKVLKVVPKKTGYSVRAICQRLGIGPHTLRAWENRYRAVVPSRSPSGQRLYSQSELERLENILALVNAGHSVGIVAKLTDKELEKLLAKGPSRAEDPTVEFAQFLESLKEALTGFELNLVSSLLDQRRSSLGSRDFVLRILTPLMRWIGESVAGKSLSIAHEHALSAVVRDQIYQTLRYGSQPIPRKQAKHFVLATPEDDLHEFGILLASALISHHGLPAHLLGANLPMEALALGTKAVKGDIVLLGNAPVPDNERRVSFEDYLRDLHRHLPKGVAIWIGGAGKIPHLRSALPGREHRFLSSLTELDALLQTKEIRG